MARIVLAYSGDLDTSIAIPLLRETQHADVITVTVDLGQGQELEAVRDRALAAGAVRAHVLDLREELARDYIVPALKADAASGNGAPIGGALALPLIARALVKIAGIEQAAAAAHGAAGRGPDRSPLDAAIRALNPSLEVIAPAHDWPMSAADAAAYAQTRRISVPATSALRVDANLWGRSVRGAALEDAWTEPSEEIYTVTRPFAEWPAEPAYVEIAFEHGSPTAVNGVAMPLLDIVSSLTTIAGAHGVGRIDAVEHGADGVAYRSVYEAPAAVVLHAAHRELQAFVTAPELDLFSRTVSRRYSTVVTAGLWFSPLREALDAFVDRVQARVTGVVRLKLFKGDCRIVGRKSPHAAHDAASLIQPSVVGA